MEVAGSLQGALPRRRQQPDVVAGYQVGVQYTAAHDVGFRAQHGALLLRTGHLADHGDTAVLAHDGRLVYVALHVDVAIGFEAGAWVQGARHEQAGGCDVWLLIGGQIAVVYIHRCLFAARRPHNAVGSAPQLAGTAAAATPRSGRAWRHAGRQEAVAPTSEAQAPLWDSLTL